MAEEPILKLIHDGGEDAVYSSVVLLGQGSKIVAHNILADAGEKLEVRDSLTGELLETSAFPSDIDPENLYPPQLVSDDDLWMYASVYSPEDDFYTIRRWKWGEDESFPMSYGSQTSFPIGFDLSENGLVVGSRWSPANPTYLQFGGNYLNLGVHEPSQMVAFTPDGAMWFTMAGSDGKVELVRFFEGETHRPPAPLPKFWEGSTPIPLNDNSVVIVDATESPNVYYKVSSDFEAEPWGQDPTDDDGSRGTTTVFTGVNRAVALIPTVNALGSKIWIWTMDNVEPPTVRGNFIERYHFPSETFELFAGEEDSTIDLEGQEYPEPLEDGLAIGPRFLGLKDISSSVHGIKRGLMLGGSWFYVQDLGGYQHDWYPWHLTEKYDEDKDVGLDVIKAIHKGTIEPAEPIRPPLPSPYYFEQKRTTSGGSE